MTDTATDRSAHGRIKIEEGRKRVRALLGGTFALDTIRPLLVWEGPYYPTYYFRPEDVQATLTPTGTVEHSPSRGDGAVYDVVNGDAKASGAARIIASSPIPELSGLVRIAWDAMDEWLEEDEPVYTHPRDPYTRIDILASSRHIRVELDGETLAESRSPRILYETHLRPRYYLPISDLRTNVLRPSSSATYCPYKGTAAYWSVEIAGQRYDDLIWIYRTPLPESQKIAGLACFYSERVDLYVDGVLEPK
jgi:uncharacterized protein (DUF427 family)